MEKLADEAGQAINDRDKAWREISRVRQLLELDLGQEQDSLDEFRVSTHFVPKGLSVIPTTLPLSQEGAAAGLQLRRHHGSELDESQLDAVDQLVRQEMRHKQGQHGGGRPARSIDDEMAGGMSMGPYSRQAGPPSLIPKPPGAMGADEPVPKSRYSSFFNLEGAAAAAAVASMSAHKAQGSVLRRGGGGDDVAILRADHRPERDGDRDRQHRAPSLSAPLHGKAGQPRAREREESSRVRPVVRKGREARHTYDGPDKSAELVTQEPASPAPPAVEASGDE